jgi:hypothetical protein
MSYDTTVGLDKFLPELLQYVPDVPEVVATNAIRNAAIEFCERTRVWQVDSFSTSIAGLASYEVDPPFGAKFVDIIFAYYGDRLLVPKVAEELDRVYRWTDWRTLRGEPVYLTRMNALEIILVPAPSEARVRIKLRAAYAPTRASNQVGVDVYENYLEVICMGARARLYNTPLQPYYDKPSANEFERKFRSAISEVRVQVNRSLTRTAPAIEFQRIV